MQKCRQRQLCSYRKAKEPDSFLPLADIASARAEKYMLPEAGTCPHFPALAKAPAAKKKEEAGNV